MRSEETKRIAEELAKAARRGAQLLAFHLSGVLDTASTRISLGCGFPLDAVTALAQELGTKAEVTLHLNNTPPIVIVSMSARISGVTVAAQGSRPATSDDYGVLPVHPPQTQCLECAAPLKNEVGSDYDKGLCATCTEGRREDALRAAKERRDEMEDVIGDVMRDASKDEVRA